MGVDATIDITPEDRQTVLALLRRHLPGTAAWVYGSRARWTSTPTSDLDLVVFATPEQQPQVGDLREAFEESNLPFRVDLFVWDDVPESFRQRIEADRAPLVGQEAGHGRTVRVAATVRRDPDGWRTRRFEELLDEPVRNGIYKSKEHHGHGVKMVNMGELFAHPRLRAVPMRRVGLSESEIERFSITRGDLLFARRSLVAEGAGKCSVVLDVDEPTAFESSIIRARPAAATSDPLYLYYFFCSPSGLHRLDTIRRQVAVAGITGRDLSGLEIPAPPLSEQRAIGHVLGALDDKIELNRRMNATLEAMARALFRSWFVDFDPVRAKMEGRDTGRPKAIADLFPDRLVDSELGEIPEGWESTRLDNVATITKGRSYRRRELVASDTALVTLKSFARGGGYRAEGLKSFGGVYKSEHVVRPGEVIVACTDVTQAAQVVGRSAVVGETSSFRTLVASLDVLIVRPKNAALGRAFVYYVTGTENFVAHALARTTGTTVLHLSKDSVTSFRFALPPRPLIAQFGHCADSLRARIQANASAVGLLADLRDALLPKLVSGEMRVRDAEKLVGAIA